MLLTTLLACAAKPPIEAAIPTLPALDAPLYAIAPGYTPTDPVVAAFLGEAAVDESLSGAAAAAALVRADGGRIDGAAVTWSAYRAGWPHPIDAWATVSVSKDELPPADFLQVNTDTASSEGAILGVARARGSAGDTWVVLSSQPRVALGAFPKSLAMGTNFEFPVTDSGAWTDLRQRAVGADLFVRRDTIQLDVAGEWIAELTGMDESEREVVLARVPLYVGDVAPEDGPFLATVPAEVEDLSGAVRAALNELRSLEGAPRLTGNASLDVAAREGLTRFLETGDPDPDALARLARLGYPEASELICKGETVTDCLEDFWWSIDDRVRLLQPEYRQVGVAPAVGDGLSVVITLSAE